MAKNKATLGTIDFVGQDDGAVWTDLRGNSWKVEIKWSIKDDLAKVSGFSLSAVKHDAPVTARLLREVPLGQIEERARALKGEQFRNRQKDAFRLVGGGTSTRSMAEVRKVADIYYQALRNGDSPHKRLVAELKVSYPTASRRIRLARDVGLISEND